MNQRIKEIRSATGLTQADFGAKLGVSQNYIWMLESGDRAPSDRIIRDICREFAINETWLRTGEGDMKLALSREEEMAVLVRQLMADRPESFRSALITTLLRFDPEGPEWSLLESIFRKVSEETKKDPGP